MATTQKRSACNNKVAHYLLLTLSLLFLVKHTSSMKMMSFPLCPPMDEYALLNLCEKYEPSHCGGRTYCLRGIGEHCDDDVRNRCKNGLTCECHKCQNCDKNNCFLESCPNYDYMPSKRYMKQHSYPFNTFNDIY